MPPFPDTSDTYQQPDGLARSPFGPPALSHINLGDAVLDDEGLVPPEMQALGGLLFEMGDLESAADFGEAKAEAPKGLLAGTFFGARLRKTRKRPARLSPIPGVFDPGPRLHGLVAPPEVGKTSLGLWVGQRWCEGLPPWDAYVELPGTRVLVVSREQSLQQIDSLLQRFEASGATGVWEDRLHIVARDPDLSERLKPLLTLDNKGLGVLKQLLREDKATGDPIGLVVLDSLSRLKPADADENDNNAISQWLDALDAIAQAHDIYILLIHHTGHGGEHRPSDPKSAARGASAFGAVTSAQLLLKPGKAKRQRILRVEGNFVLGGEITFEVCSPQAHENSIHYFKPTDPYSIYDPVELVGRVAISTNELAWRLSGKKPEPGKNPAGTATRLASKLRDHWLGQGVVEIFDGPRGAKMIRLKACSD